MTNKRKLPKGRVVENIQPSKSDEENGEISEDDLLNVVNGDDEDSSDSDKDLDSDSDENSDDNVDEDEEGTDNDNDDTVDDSNDEEEEDNENEDSNEEDDQENEESEDENESDEDNNSSEQDDDEEENVNESTTKQVPQQQVDESDTSDEEDIRNTVGNIPKNWYDDYTHLGYDWDANKILKPITGDQLDEFLNRIDNPDFWRTVKDLQTNQNIVLSNEDIETIRRIKNQKTPDGNFDEYAPWIEWFTSEVMQTPVRKFPEHKRSFLPSQSDAKKISKLVHALKMGWIQTRAQLEAARAKKEPKFYDLWGGDDEEMRRIHKHIPAPKRLLPTHAESYNPPSEYLFDDKELKLWNKLKNSPWKRKLHFVPQKFRSLREVPSYPRFIKERFLRCLDLYLAPRGYKMKLSIEPEDLVPQLPSPRDLQPFPTTLALEYKGHSDMVRSITIDPSGQYMASGSDDGTVKIWEVNTSRCLKTVTLGGTVKSVEWCPNHALSLVLIACDNKTILVNPQVGDSLVCQKTDDALALLNSSTVKSSDIVSERVKNTVTWSDPDTVFDDPHVRLVLTHFKSVSQATWHAKGDYFASVMPDGQNRSVLISQISRRRSQLPFTKSKGLVQCATFHPSRPLLFVATQRHVRVYDLVKQMLIKKLLTNSKWVSSLAIHPMGDNLIVGTYDRKMLWFDLDLSTKPYQTLRLHGTAVRGVVFHKRYPLFASGSDDLSVIVCHGMVYNDLLKNPLIVPLKRLQDHQRTNDFGVLGVAFHPWQPWVFSCGADATIKMYSN